MELVTYNKIMRTTENVENYKENIMAKSTRAGSNETKFKIKHNDQLNPVATKTDDFSDSYIPQWNDDDQRLEESNVYTDKTTDTTVVDNKAQFNDTVTLGDVNNKVDLHINGDIIQNGDAYETHAEQLYTTKDHIILREGAISGLLDNEHSGLTIEKYDGTNDLHLCVDNSGYAQVGEIGDKTYDYEFTTEDLYFTEDENGNYKYYDDLAKTKEHVFYIPKEATDITFDSPVINDNQCSVRFTYKLTESTLQRIATIEKNTEDQSLVYFDKESSKLRTLEKPDAITENLVPILNKDTKRVEYAPTCRLETFTGADHDNDGISGLVPAPTKGRKKYLSSEGSWDNVEATVAEQAIFDLVHPIGETYTQYPWQKSPMELYNVKDNDDSDIIKSFWNIIKDYDGAFFRSEGGQAEPFQEEKDPKGTKLYPNLDLFTAAITKAQFESQYDVAVRDYIFSPKDCHVKHIEKQENGNYLVTTFTREYEIAPTQHLYYFNIDIGTVDDLVNNKLNWKSEFIDEWTLDTSVAAQKYKLTLAGTSNPSAAQNVVQIKPYTDDPTYNNHDANCYYKDGSTTLQSLRSPAIYGNGTNLGHIEGQFNLWNAKIDENGNIYYTVNENSANPITGNPVVLSIPSSANPTPAQHIVEFYRTPKSNQITCTFEDGHQAAYADTTTVYDHNISLGDFRGLEINFELTTYDLDEIYVENNDEISFSIASTATPTPAQLITSWHFCDTDGDDLEDFIVTYEDGHIQFRNEDAWNVYNKTELLATTSSLRDAALIAKKEKTYSLIRPLATNTWKTGTAANLQPIETISVNDTWTHIKTLDGKIVSQKPNTWLYVDDKKTCTFSLVPYKWTAFNDDIYIPTYSIPASVFTGNVDDTNDVYQAEYLPETNEIKFYYNDNDGESQFVIYPIDTEFTYNGTYFTGEWILLDYQNIEITRDVWCPIVNGADGNLDADGEEQPRFPGQTDHHGRGADSRIRVNSSSTSTSNQIYRLFFTEGSAGKFTIVEFADGHLNNYAYNLPIYDNFNGNYFRAYVLEHQPVMKTLTVPAWKPPKEVNGKPVALERTSSFIDPASPSDRLVHLCYHQPNSPMYGYVLSVLNGRQGEPTPRERSSVQTFTLFDVESKQAIAIITTAGGTNFSTDAQLGDVEYYYPPEKDWYGYPITYSIANTATPTDAQIITKIDPIEGSTNYNAHFKDGHTAVYAQTQAMYFKGYPTNSVYWVSMLGAVVTTTHKIITTPTLYTIPPENVYASTASNANPTDAQHIIKIKWLDGQTSMLDFLGNSTVALVGATANVYDKNVLLGQHGYTLQVDWQERAYGYQKEALPNVKGHANYNNEGFMGGYSNGAFYPYGYGAMGTTHRVGVYAVNFDSSYFTKQYGRRGEVAPNNYTMRIWVRVKEEDYNL